MAFFLQHFHPKNLGCCSCLKPLLLKTKLVSCRKIKCGFQLTKAFINSLTLAKKSENTEYQANFYLSNELLTKAMLTIVTAYNTFEYRVINVVNVQISEKLLKELSKTII